MLILNSHSALAWLTSGERFWFEGSSVKDWLAVDQSISEWAGDGILDWIPKEIEAAGLVNGSTNSEESLLLVRIVMSTAVQSVDWKKNAVLMAEWYKDTFYSCTYEIEDLSATASLEKKMLNFSQWFFSKRQDFMSGEHYKSTHQHYLDWWLF